MASFAHRGPSPFYRPPAEMPLILCGPMLRKVTRTSVSVFLALKEPCLVSLQLHPGPAAAAAPLAASAFQPTVPIGRHLHLIVVTLDLDPGQALSPRTTYGYDLVFEKPGLPADGLALSRDVLCQLLEPNPFGPGETAITYRDEQLPSFTLPAREVTKLRLVHGSCRKPHGEGPDMLAMLDDLLAARHANLDERPQLLLLTGDQIYADDVSPVLLRCLSDSLPVLLGWRETVPSPHLLLPPGIPPPPLSDWLTVDELASDGTWTHTSMFETSVRHLFDPARASRIAPPQRGREVRANGGLSSDEADAHLVFLGEFLLMYLFGWSDTLWPRAAGASALRLPEPIEAVPSLSLFGKFNHDALLDHRSTLESFAGGLKKVRRALANIPTFMIFDDHEVTDDWNLNQDWVRRVNTSPMGPRILRNALVAYALCQDWGSQPEHYAGDEPGARILDAVRYEGSVAPAPAWPPNEPPPGPPQPAPRIMHDRDPAKVFELLGIGPQHFAREPQKIWHYVIDPYAGEDQREYQILVLDTRTRRKFPDQSVIDQATSGLKALLGDSQPFAGLVLNAALLSDAAFRAQLDEKIDERVVNLVVSPAPLFGVAVVEDVGQRLLVMKNGPEIGDNEAWTGNQEAFQRFVTALRGAARGAVVLSGDVHYAFSHRISFPDHQGDPLPHATVQLCASAFQNQSLGTRLLGAIDPRMDRDHFIPVASQRLREIQDTLNAKLKEKLALLGLDGGPVVVGSPLAMLEPFWEWGEGMLRGSFDPAQVALELRDLNPFTLPQVTLVPVRLVLGVNAATGFYSWLEQDLLEANRRFTVDYLGDVRAPDVREPAEVNAGRQAPDHVRAFARDQGRLIVGHNNLGEISFAGAGSSTTVRHTLYWPMHDRTQKSHAPYMATLHEAALTT